MSLKKIVTIVPDEKIWKGGMPKPPKPKPPEGKPPKK